MIKETLYHYLGTNGTILSPVYLEGIYSVKKLRLMADDGKVLTRDNKNFESSVIIPEYEESLWREVPVGQV